MAALSIMLGFEMQHRDGIEGDYTLNDPQYHVVVGGEGQVVVGSKW